MKAWVQYGTVVQGKWGPELVRDGAVPEEEINDEGDTVQVWDYSDRLDGTVMKDTSREIGNVVTVIVIDGNMVPEGYCWKAIGDILSKY